MRNPALSVNLSGWRCWVVSKATAAERHTRPANAIVHNWDRRRSTASSVGVEKPLIPTIRASRSRALDGLGSGAEAGCGHIVTYVGDRDDQALGPKGPCRSGGSSNRVRCLTWGSGAGLTSDVNMAGAMMGRRVGCIYRLTVREASERQRLLGTQSKMPDRQGTPHELQRMLLAQTLPHRFLGNVAIPFFGETAHRVSDHGVELIL